MRRDRPLNIPTPSGITNLRPQGFREYQLVEQSAIQLLAETDWRTVSALKEVCGVDCTLGRETKGEVVLLPRLLTALDPLNSAFPPRSNLCSDG